MLRTVSSVTAALLLIAGTATAQTSGANGTSGGSGTSEGSTSTQTTTSQTTTMQSGSFDDQEHQSWFASGLVGSAFARSADDANVNVGLAVGYLFRRAAGVEFSADFAPNFVVGEIPLGETQVNSYMVNAIGALPIGSETTIQPFITGGIGALTLRSNQSQFGIGLPGIDNNQFAWNLGAGVMGFRSRIGFRADVRYIRGAGNANDDNASASGLDNNGNFLLNNVDFWRTNVGVAFRW